MEPVSELFLTIAGAVFQFLVVLPVIAVFREDGCDEMGRMEFAFWLAGYLFAWFVLTIIGVILLNSGRVVFLLVWPGLLVGGICVYAMFHFFEAVVQRARDAGHGRAIAYLAAIPPFNLVVFAYLLWRPSVPRGTSRRGRRRRRLRRLRTGLSAWLRRLAWNVLNRIFPP